MAYDEDLANRIRELVLTDPAVTEKAMFGGLAFLISGNMSVAASSSAGSPAGPPTRARCRRSDSAPQIRSMTPGRVEFQLLGRFQTDQRAGMARGMIATGDRAQGAGDHVDGRRRPAQLSRQFPADPDSAAAARKFVADALHVWGQSGMLVENAQLIVSELATNAIIHAGSPFSLVARCDGSRVRLEVRDGSRTQPRVGPCGQSALAGRGLQIVGVIAHRWGVEATDDGKAVWAELRS